MSKRQKLYLAILVTISFSCQSSEQSGIAPTPPKNSAPGMVQSETPTPISPSKNSQIPSGAITADLDAPTDEKSDAAPSRERELARREQKRQNLAKISQNPLENNGAEEADPPEPLAQPVARNKKPVKFKKANRSAEKKDEAKPMRPAKRPVTVSKKKPALSVAGVASGGVVSPSRARRKPSFKPVRPTGTGKGYGPPVGTRPAPPLPGDAEPPLRPEEAPIELGNSLDKSLEDPAPETISKTTSETVSKYADANAFYENTYQGGSGARERIKELVENGVIIEGKSLPLDALTAEYRQPFPLPVESALGLSVGSEYLSLLESGGRTIIQVGLQGMETETPSRPPLRIALVIDRSGSMAKEKRMEKVKEAVKNLVGKLKKDDQIAIVSFHSKAEVLYSLGSSSSKEVLEAIEKIKPAGGTNIYDGLTLGYKELQSLPVSDEGFRVTLLFSDGQVTAGVKDIKQFDTMTRSAFASKISTTSFGVGLSFNEELMMKISQSGKGNYHFLKDAAGSETAIAQELENYTQIVASNVLVRVKLSDGVKLIRVLGTRTLDQEETLQVKADEELLDNRAREELGIAEDRSKDDEDGIKTLIPQFYLADTHMILLEVEVPKGVGTRSIAEVFVKYKDQIFSENQSLSESIFVKTANEQEAVTLSLDSSVKKNILGFRTGEILMKAAEHLRLGNNQEAQRLLEEQQEILATASGIWVDEDLERDAKLIAQYKEVIDSLGNKSVAGTKEGEMLAKAFVYTGYQMGK